MSRYASRPALPEHLRKSRPNEGAMTLESVLSAPYPDLAGDRVDPAGLDFAPHAATAVIDLEHRRDARVLDRPVAWARPSLKKAGPYHHPVPTKLNFGTDDEPEWHVVPVGKEWFDPSDRLSSQVFALCCADALPGRSLEFSPVGGYAKALGRSPLEDRPAYHFRKALVHCWTVCAQPVCEQALQQQIVAKAVRQVPPGEAMVRVLRDRRVNVGGRWEDLLPELYKALAPTGTPKRTTIRVEKAMDETMAPETTSALEARTEGPEDAAAESPALGGVSAKYEFAQAILDAVDRYEQAMQSSDSPELRKLAEKFKDMAMGLAEKVKGAADKHDARLNGGAEPDGDETGEMPSDGDGDAPADMSTDDDGVMKAVRPVYYKALKGKRFTPAEIQKGQEPTPEEAAQMMGEIARLKKRLSYYN